MADDLGYESTLYLSGVSVGQPHQHSTLTLMERHEVVHHDDPAADWNGKTWDATISYTVLDILRPEHIEPRDLINLIRAKAVDSEMVMVDISRTGVAFADDLRRLRNVFPIRLIDRAEIQKHNGFWSVPTLDVLVALQRAASERRFTAPGHDRALRAIMSFDPEVRGEADDIVTAIASAIWWSEDPRCRKRRFTRQPPVPRTPIEADRPMTFNDALSVARAERRRRTRI